MKKAIFSLLLMAASVIGASAQGSATTAQNPPVFTLRRTGGKKENRHTCQHIDYILHHFVFVS